MTSEYGYPPALKLAQDKYEKGLAAHKNGNLRDAQVLYRESLGLQPDHFEALHLLGVIAAQENKFIEAIELLRRSLKINPSNVVAIGNLGNAFRDTGRYQAALECYDEAMTLQPGYIKIRVSRDEVLQKMHQQAQSNSRNAEIAAVHFKRALEFSASRQFEAAIENYDRAIQVQPDFSVAFFNRGNALNVLERRQAAIDSYDRAIALSPENELWKCVRLATKLHVCDWSVPTSQVLQFVQDIQRKGQIFFPFLVLALSSSLSIQRKAAEVWVNAKAPLNSELGMIPKREVRERIRVGYFSMDFCIHPVSTLAVELFETHDRSRFEVFAFSFGPDTQDDMRKRLEMAFDHFIDVSDKSDSEIAKMARNLEIDIAVDLAGLAGASRPGIFARRAAPLQVNYLGYPGSMGTSYMDYLLADKTLIPTRSQAEYSEKIVYLPTFQANDSKRGISDKVFNRKDFGLPEFGFVFCCFNNNYKITPETFDGWMRILKRVENSVLFLYEENALVAFNLAKEAVSRGVESDRLVFGKRLSNAEYLARYRLADLFLDTLPFNAGATASDALWAGLPVLTCQGEAFASRMASSLLTALDLPELITTNQEDYVNLAVELGNNPGKVTTIKETLMRNRLTSPLFNSPLFARNLEQAFTTMVERYRSDLPPDHIHVG